MFKKMLLSGVGVAGMLATSSALAQTVVAAGTPADGLAHSATFTENTNRQADGGGTPSENTVLTIGFPTNTGAVSVLENGATGNGLAAWSDLVIFYDSTAGCAAAINGPQTATADTVVIFSSPSSTGFTAANINSLCPGITIPAGSTFDAVIQASPGYTVGPTENVDGAPDAGPNSVTYTAGTGTYTILDPVREPVPALPNWALALFAAALLIPGAYFVNRSRLTGGSATA